MDTDYLELNVEVAESFSAEGYAYEYWINDEGELQSIHCPSRVVFRRPVLGQKGSLLIGRKTFSTNEEAYNFFNNYQRGHTKLDQTLNQPGQELILHQYPSDIEVGRKLKLNTPMLMWINKTRKIDLTKNKNHRYTVVWGDKDYSAMVWLQSTKKFKGGGYDSFPVHESALAHFSFI